MKCFKCGRELPDDAKWCSACGHEIVPSYPSLLHDKDYARRQRTYATDLWVTVIILVVFVLVLVPAFIYFLFVMVEDAGVDIPAGDLVTTRVPGGMRFSFANVTVPVPWFGVQVSVWSGEVGWSTGWQVAGLSMEMFGNMTWYGDESPLGSITVRLIVTDVGEDGLIDTGDFFTITTNMTSGFVSGTEYGIEVDGSHCAPPFGQFAEATYRG